MKFTIPSVATQPLMSFLEEPSTRHDNLEIMRKPSQRNSTRDREKAELTALRSLVGELETHLATLSRGERSLSRPQPQFRQGGKSAWRCVAERQLRARRAAEQTNRALNDRVQSNADWIQRLWELLHEKRKATKTSSFKRMAALPRKAEDDLVLGRLKEQVEASVLQLPKMFTKHGIRVLDESLQGVEPELGSDLWIHKQTGDLESALVCVRRVPFDMHSTSCALWTALSRPEGSFASGNGTGMTPHDIILKARVIERTPSLCTMKVQDKLLLNNETAVVDYHAVVHRSTLGKPYSAIVFVWQSLFTLTDGSIKHEDTMWATVLRSPSGRMESIVAIVSQSQLETKTGFNGALDLKTSTMASAEECVDSILSSAEDMLLSESLSGSSHSSSSTDEMPGSISV